jgi:hypothetical protein
MLMRSARTAPPPSLCHVCSGVSCRRQELPAGSVVEDNSPAALGSGVAMPAGATSTGAVASSMAAGVKLVHDIVGHTPQVSLSTNVLHITSWCGRGRFFVTPTAREACDVCMVCLVQKAQRLCLSNRRKMEPLTLRNNGLSLCKVPSHSYSPFSVCEYLPVTPDTRTGSGSRSTMTSVWARCGHGNSGSCIHMLTLQERLGPVRTSCHHHAGRKNKSPALRCATNHCCTRKLVCGWTSCRSLACAWDVPKWAPPYREDMLSPSSRGGALQNVFSPASMKQTRPESSKWHPTT